MARKYALLVIDMQHRFRGMAESMGIIPRVVKLVKHCHEMGVPVVFTQHHDVRGSGSKVLEWWNDPIIKGSEDWELLPEMKEVLDPEKDIRIQEKTKYDSFFKTELEEELRSLGVNAVVVVGAMTNLCCETTARSAFCRDFDVVFLEDGNATMDAKYHEATLLNLGVGFAKIMTAAECENIFQ
ncbi:unnamed protein product [Darwinula stevensoni]|uniref:Isochorismatase-like domain-containing protein n=1 Tax=Darwinula stevensoni TaxID=69355 RepID=A0A7R8XAB2_9CRUS|nr:unnamed protein product [Darwinula stevensoni]CAG0889820.1 unnamed protein product [Darwinula stevensoni]